MFKIDHSINSKYDVLGFEIPLVLYLVQDLMHHFIQTLQQPLIFSIIAPELYLLNRGIIKDFLVGFEQHLSVWTMQINRFF